ncbi:hypothetical protein JCM19235_3296 [Vibrio maritimus]|uniref:Uncharacterized protein n=1 Tax=Vibrio maritimus TaxID=990268 RepID=A0A090S529_9VIBR|nr:hypothetical protein JCM19235_3296 [Vibrio maritimus]
MSVNYQSNPSNNVSVGKTQVEPRIPEWVIFTVDAVYS